MENDDLVPAMGFPPQAQNNPMDSDFAKFIETGEDMLFQLYLDWQGLEIDQSSTESVQFLETGEVMMNKKGTKSIIATLRTFLNKNTWISETTEIEGAKLKKILADEISIKLFISRKDFGITDSNNIKHITVMCFPFINFAINRAVAGSDKNFLAGTMSISEIRSHGGQQGLTASLIDKLKR